MNNAELFSQALEELNNEWETRGVNLSTRANMMIMMSLLQVDIYKIANVPGNKALTEKEFLELCKRVYWQTRESLQAEV